MKIQVVRKKASSLRELGHEEMEITPVATLGELLAAVARVEFEKQHGKVDTQGETAHDERPAAQGAAVSDGKPGAKEGAARGGNLDAQGAIPSRMAYAGEEELKAEGRLGKVQFGESYDDRPGDWEKALGTLFQDFEDGLYRVYIDGEEYTELSGSVSLEENAQVVFLRLVMLSGRLW